MAKNLFQDMVRAKRESRGTAVHPQSHQKLSDSEVSRENVLPAKRHDKRGPKYTLWFVAVVSLVFFLFALSYLFGRVVVTVNPKIEDIVLNENLSAGKDTGTADLPFDLVVISGEETKVVQTSEEKDFSQKAEGIVVLYNTFNASPQILNIDTRLEGSNGKIYKTKTRTVVPGKTPDGKPGLVEVKIYGSNAGQDYDSEPLDFKVVNFKGTPKYEKFYGRSKGPITGGLKGRFSIISDDEKLSVLDEMKTAIQSKLLKKAMDQTPPGFVLFKDAVYLRTDDNDIDFTSVKDNMLPINLKGTLYGILFDVEKLSKKIAQDNIPKYDGSDVFVPNIQDLTFTLSNKDNITFEDLNKINFNLSGSAKIVWKLDANKIVSDLLGKSKGDFSKILLKYPNINSANLVLSPIWKFSFPDNAEKIEVIVNYPPQL